jgi:hypothetical protein
MLLFSALLALASAARAHADDGPRRAHTIYGEVLGKGGLWGVGYDYRPGLAPIDRFGVGVAASYNLLDGQRVLTLSPYLSFVVLERGRHAWFVQAGPHIVRVDTPSPVPEWDGTSSSGVGAQLTSGWEMHGDAGSGHTWIVRAFAVGTLGRGRFAPWAGADFGWSF